MSLINLKKIAGSPCANMHGYCDVFSVCRRVDKSGPLKRLKERFFTVKGKNKCNIHLTITQGVIAKSSGPQAHD